MASLTENFYGVRVSEKATTVTAPTVAQSGITIAFGTAPIHQVDGTPNEIVTAYTYEEAVSALGWSDNWEKYTLCEAMYAHFKLFGVAPLLLVNVLDPTKYTEEVTEQSYPVTNGQITLTGDALSDTITVKNGNTACTAGTDYSVFYEDGVCYIEAVSGGALEGASSATVSYSQVSFEAASLKSAVIGGYDTGTGKSTGLELMDMAYFKSGLVPDLIIAPGFSQMPEVAAVMAAKAKSYSVVFRATALCDLDTESATTYDKAVEAKSGDSAFRATRQKVFWPMVSMDGRMFHLSTQAAARMAASDAENDNVPSEPESNKTIQADSAVLADGTEVLLDLNAANYLRDNGIATALNFVNGWTLWGAYNACYPDSSDPKDLFTNVSRMFTYVCNTAILTYWSKIDRKLTPRYAASIADDLSLWLNGLVADGHLLGARCALNASENPTADLMNGIIRLHIYMTPAGPAQEIDFVCEYDVAYVSTLASQITV